MASVHLTTWATATVENRQKAPGCDTQEKKVEALKLTSLVASVRMMSMVACATITLRIIAFVQILLRQLSCARRQVAAMLVKNAGIGLDACNLGI